MPHAIPVEPPVVGAVPPREVAAAPRRWPSLSEWLWTAAALAAFFGIWGVV